MKKIWIGIGIVIVIALVILVVITQTKKEQSVIKIGASLPLTGEVASYGIKAQRGIEIGVEEVNLAGGIKGKELNVVFEDDQNDPKTGVAIIKKFVTVDKVPAVIGSAGSTVSLAMAPIVNQYKVVLLSPISSSVKLTIEGGPFFFRVCPADDAQAKILARWVLEKGYRKAAIIFTNNSWGKPLAEAFKVYFEDGGGKVVIYEGVEEKTTDLRTQLAKIKSSGVDVVISPTYPVEGGSLIKQAKEMGVKAEFYGGDNWDAPEFLTVAGEAAEGVFFVDPSEIKAGKYFAFAEKYKKKYNEEPDINAAFGYDALIALAEAMKLAENLSGLSIQKALYQVSFDGASSKIKFDENGDLENPAFDRNVIKNGKKLKIEE
jgi:branched-chain amino acid transport system substrate-binding protein